MSSDEVFNRAEKAALKKQMKLSTKAYVKEYLDAEAKRAARAVVKKLKTEIRSLVEEEFRRRLPKAVKSSIGKIRSSVQFWTTSKSMDYYDNEINYSSKI